MKSKSKIDKWRFIFAKGGGGGGGGTTQVVEKSNPKPWEGLRNPLRFGYDEARRAFEATPKGPFQGKLIADPTTQQQNALTQQESIANSMVGQGAPVVSLGQHTLAGDYLKYDSNPYLKPAIENSLVPVTEKFTQEILPSIRSQAIAHGAYGGARHGIAEGIAAGKYADAATRIANQIAFDNYNRERINQQNAPALISQGRALNLQPTEILNTVGAQRRQWAQDALDEAAAKFQAEQLAPWTGLGEYMSILGAGGVPFGTTASRTGTVAGQSALRSALGGAVGGGLMGATLQPILANSATQAMASGAAPGVLGAFAATNPLPFIGLSALGGGLMGGVF